MMLMMVRSAWLGKKENTEAALSAFQTRCQRRFHQNTQIHNLILLNILVKSAIWLTQHIKQVYVLSRLAESNWQNLQYFRNKRSPQPLVVFKTLQNKMHSSLLSLRISFILKPKQNHEKFLAVQNSSIGLIVCPLL